MAAAFSASFSAVNPTQRRVRADHGRLRSCHAGLAWLGSYLSLKNRIETCRSCLWFVFLSFPLPFIAILTGWYTAEVGRQP
jgi:cytochrome bd-type quinol oxidase subunit 1